MVMLAGKTFSPGGKPGSLIRGLKEIEGSWRKGKFRLDPSLEDVHSNVESYLIARIRDRGWGATPHRPQPE